MSGNYKTTFAYHLHNVNYKWLNDDIAYSRLYTKNTFQECSLQPSFIHL